MLMEQPKKYGVGQAASEGDIFSKWNGMIIPKPY